MNGAYTAPVLHKLTTRKCNSPIGKVLHLHNIQGVRLYLRDISMFKGKNAVSNFSFKISTL